MKVVNNPERKQIMLVLYEDEYKILRDKCPRGITVNKFVYRILQSIIISSKADLKKVQESFE